MLGLAAAASLFVAGLTVTAYAIPPPSCTWQGLNGSWSEPSHWACSSGTIPENGGDLVFPVAASQNITSNNDIAGLEVHHIDIIGTPTFYSYTFTGQSINVSGGITDTANIGVQFSSAVTLSSNQTFTTSTNRPLNFDSTLDVGTYTLTTGGSMFINGSITGSGIVRVTSDSMYLSTANPNFSGQWEASGGNLRIHDPSQLGTVSAAVVVTNGGQLYFLSNIGFTTYDIPNPITIDGNDALHFEVSLFGTGTANLSGLVTLANDATAELTSYDLNLTGRLNTNGHTLTGATGNSGTLTNSANGYLILSNAETSQPVTLTTPQGTLITNNNAVNENSLAAQDAAYDYPLGLVDYTFTNAGPSNQIVLTFVTDLAPGQVVARKYDPTAQTFASVPSATITSTTYNGQAALQLAYTIADNGSLDQDSTIGTVTDPVGLGIVASSSTPSSPAPPAQTPAAPKTGYGLAARTDMFAVWLAISTAAAIGTGLSLLYKKRQPLQVGETRILEVKGPRQSLR